MFFVNWSKPDDIKFSDLQKRIMDAAFQASCELNAKLYPLPQGYHWSFKSSEPVLENDRWTTTITAYPERTVVFDED